MGQVRNTPNDAMIDVYRQLKAMRREIDRLRASAPTFAIQTPVGQTFFLTAGDGTNWIDSSDGTLHYMFGGFEYKLTGTVVP